LLGLLLDLSPSAKIVLIKEGQLKQVFASVGQNQSSLLCGFEVSGKEHFDVILVEPAVTSGSDAVCLQYSPVIPPPNRINMHIKKPGYLSGCQQTI